METVPKGLNRGSVTEKIDCINVLLFENRDSSKKKKTTNKEVYSSFFTSDATVVN